MRGNTCLSRRKDLNDQKYRHIWQRIRVIRLKRRSRFNSFTEWKAGINAKLKKQSRKVIYPSVVTFTVLKTNTSSEYFTLSCVSSSSFTHRECRELLFINVDDLRHVWVLNVFLQLQTKQHQWKKHFTHTVNSWKHWKLMWILSPCCLSQWRFRHHVFPDTAKWNHLIVTGCTFLLCELFF